MGLGSKCDSPQSRLTFSRRRASKSSRAYVSVESTEVEGSRVVALQQLLFQESSDEDGRVHKSIRFGKQLKQSKYHMSNINSNSQTVSSPMLNLRCREQ